MVGNAIGHMMMMMTMTTRIEDVVVDVDEDEDATDCDRFMRSESLWNGASHYSNGMEK